MSAIVTEAHRRAALRLLWRMSFGETRPYPTVPNGHEELWCLSGTDRAGACAGAVPVAQALADAAEDARTIERSAATWFLRKWAKNASSSAPHVLDQQPSALADLLGLTGESCDKDLLLFSAWSLNQAAQAIESLQHAYEWAAACVMAVGKPP